MKSNIIITLFSLIGLCFYQVATATNANRIRQRIDLIDSETKEPLVGASILYKIGEQTKGTLTDVRGIAYIEELPGEYQLTISYIGYISQTVSVMLDNKKSLTIQLNPDNKVLEEVIVTASESKGMTSSSKIDTQAMAHLQPSSFTDLLSLLPGGKAIDPQMGNVNLIRIREANKTSSFSDFSSLGTSFVVDDIPLSGDANLQTIGTGLQTNEKRDITSKGIDMRTLSTDNIESVEIIRGIPSVKYGDVSTGVVKIKRKSEASPLRFRFKADQYSKLFYMGKGIDMNDHSVLNLDLDYFDSKIDPRNSMENFKRITSSLRFTSRYALAQGFLKWNSSFDFSGTFDEEKKDPEVDLTKDRYKSSVRRLSLNNQLKFTTYYTQGLQSISFSPSLSAQFDKIKQTKEVFLNVPSAIPNSKEEGSHDAYYLPSHYVSQLEIDGKPLYGYIQLNSEWAADFKGVKQDISVGADYRYNKNKGKGSIYDTQRPPSPLMTTRPRAYKDIPASQVLSAYLEDNLSISFSEKHQLDIQAGVRAIALTGLNNQYDLQNKIHWDPRINLLGDILNLPLGKHQFNWKIGLGWGILTKLPTIAQLYPDKLYLDLPELNYYHNNSDYRRLILNTHIYDRENYHLKANRNAKWEIRTDISWGNYRLSATYFREKTTTGFRGINTYAIMDYRKYDTSGIDNSHITAKPNPADLPYTEEKEMTTIGSTGNGARLDKEGIEFQLSTPRFKTINTRVTLNGAWYKTSYNNSTPLWYDAQVIIDNKALPYLGYYDWNEKREYQELSTNLMLDTQIPSLGLTFSTTLQSTWLDKSLFYPRSGTPKSYVGIDGIVHPYTEESAQDPYLKQLELRENQTSRNRMKHESIINLKANKSFGKTVDIALFVNRILSYTPSYNINGAKVYRTLYPYFGMELNLKF